MGPKKKYYNEVQGYNMRLDELQAALLSVKLKYLQNWTAQRQEIALWYNEALKELSEIKLPYCHPDATHAYHLYVIQSEQRDALQQYLHNKGIGTLIHYPVSPHLQKAYKYLGFQKGDFPIAEKMADTLLSLPLWPFMKQNEVKYVADSIRSFYK